MCMHLSSTADLLPFIFKEVCSCNFPYPMTVQSSGFWEVGLLNCGAEPPVGWW